MRFAASFALLLVAGAATAAEQTFLFDVLRLKPYRASWEKLMKSVEPTPDWLMHFNRNFDGTSGEMIDMKIEEKPYQLSFVCKPTECAAHKFEVLFDAAGEHAYGALGGKDEPPAFYGAPAPAQQQALAKALAN
jgi:inhibitor of lysozyme (Ivy)